MQESEKVCSGRGKISKKNQARVVYVVVFVLDVRQKDTADGMGKRVGGGLTQCETQRGGYKLLQVDRGRPPLFQILAWLTAKNLFAVCATLLLYRLYVMFLAGDGTLALMKERRFYDATF